MVAAYAHSVSTPAETVTCVNQELVRRSVDIAAMTPPKQLTALRLDDDLLEAMRRLQERDGISLSEQVRRALRPWLEMKGVIEKVRRKRVVTRKRASAGDE
jgi:uncharacterized protein (DUF4415 family)